MINYLNVLFYLKKFRAAEGGKALIYLRVTINGELVEQTVKRKIETAAWDSKSQRARGKSETTRILNNYLHDVSNKIHRTYNLMLEAGEEITHRLNFSMYLNTYFLNIDIYDEVY